MRFPVKYRFFISLGLLLFCGPLWASDYDLGLIAFSKGQGQQAVLYFEKAAARGDAGAADMLMRMYQHGEGVKVDAAKAFRWATQAAQSGLMQAQYQLGEFYRLGLGTAKDPKAAFSWYQRSLAQGNHWALMRVAEFYEQGISVEQNAEKAFRFYNLVASELQVFAEKGDPRAQTQLAFMYVEGKGTRTNTELALQWYRRAAQQGYAQAQLELGQLLAEGRKVKQDKMEARYWLKRAAEQGVQKAKDLLG